MKPTKLHSLGLLFGLWPAGAYSQGGGGANKPKAAVAPMAAIGDHQQGTETGLPHKPCDLACPKLRARSGKLITKGGGRGLPGTRLGPMHRAAANPKNEGNPASGATHPSSSYPVDSFFFCNCALPWFANRTYFSGRTFANLISYARQFFNETFKIFYDFFHSHSRWNEHAASLGSSYSSFSLTLLQKRQS